MRFDVISLFPDMVRQTAETGVLGRALQRQLLELHCWNPRDYTHDKHRTVDDRPYGGGPGMLMKVQPLRDAIQAARKAAGSQSRVVYLSPQGQQLNQQTVNRLAKQSGLILIAGRYEGIDERIVDAEVDEEYSIGDYVISGGELAASVLIDAVARMIPGVLGDAESAQQDSFMQGLLDCPHYTRPEEIDGCKVPEVLLGGNHKLIETWRHKQALGRTFERRPDLLNELQLTDEQQRLLDEYCQTIQQAENS